MEIFIIIVLSVLGFIAYYAYEDYKSKKEYEKWQEGQVQAEKRREARKLRYREKLNEFNKQYGHCSNAIGEWNSDIRVRVYESSRIVLINEKVFRFDDILSCEVVTETEQLGTESKKVSVSAGSMIGRAAVGALIAGPLGAVVGAGTAKRKVVSTTPLVSCKYIVYVCVRDIKNPQLKLKAGPNEQLANNLMALFHVIMNS